MAATVSPPQTLGAAAVRYTVLANDPMVPNVSATYWDNSLPYYRSVDSALERLVRDDPVAARARRELMADPHGVEPADRLARAVVPLAESRPEAVRELRSLIATADEHIRIDYHIGAAYDRSAAPVTVADLAALAAKARPVRAGAPTEPLVHVVIPFRDRGQSRARNLMACLLGLRDQTLPADRVVVTVVENDEHSRWAEPITAAADNYLFIRSDGPFNKSWTVNVGVMNAAADAELICVLDADILPANDFLRRHAELIAAPDVVGCRFHELYCMDPPASADAIRLRCSRAGGSVPPERLRCYVIRPTPGGCHWVTREAFLARNGMDERYEGWGREDNDFITRLAARGTLLRSTEPLLHMEHDRPTMRKPDGTLFNLGITHDWSEGRRRYGDPAGPSTG
jgi:hypothetical protein